MNRERIKKLAAQLLNYTGDISFREELSHHFPQAAIDHQEEIDRGDYDDSPDMKAHYTNVVRLYNCGPGVVAAVEKLAGTDEELTPKQKRDMQTGLQLLEHWVDVMRFLSKPLQEDFSGESRDPEALAEMGANLDRIKKNEDRQRRLDEEEANNFTAIRTLYRRLTNELGIERPGPERGQGF